MSDLKEAKQNPEKSVWEALEDSHAVMLGCDGLKHHQPMAPQVDHDGGVVWFFTDKAAEIAKATMTPTNGMICLINDDQDFHACISGSLVQELDHEKVEEFWSPVVSAWYKDGQKDPNLTLLKFTPDEAALWASTDSSIKFGWEIAKANLTDSQPDVGYKTIIPLQSSQVGVNA